MEQRVELQLKSWRSDFETWIPNLGSMASSSVRMEAVMPQRPFLLGAFGPPPSSPWLTGQVKESSLHGNKKRKKHLLVLVKSAPFLTVNFAAARNTFTSLWEVPSHLNITTKNQRPGAQHTFLPFCPFCPFSWSMLNYLRCWGRERGGFL